MASESLYFKTLAELCADVDAAGPRRWLVRGIWPSGAYGVHAAEMKAQKTWNALDLAVSVASGTPWLGVLPVDDAGPVIVFAGEGGAGSIVRRIRAICASRALDAEGLPISVCVRAPHLNDDKHLAQVAAQLEAVRPRLVVLDPLYLAAGGADGRDLYSMGRLLERPQHMCAAVDAALFVVTHYNRREGTGPGRFTGAGPAEWGRVLIGASVVSRETDPLTSETTVVVQLDAIGGEIADQTLRLKRQIRADDPDDIDSVLHYTVEAGRDDPEPPSRDQRPPAARKLLEALHGIGHPAHASEIGDAIAAKYGKGLRRETISRHLTTLGKEGVIAQDADRRWALTNVTAVSDCDGHSRSHVVRDRDLHIGHGHTITIPDHRSGEVTSHTAQAAPELGRQGSLPVDADASPTEAA